MIKKLKDIRTYGLIFTIAAAVFIIAFSAPFFIEARLQPFLYNCGIDSMGSIVCAALFYGCMRQKGVGIRTFLILIVLVCSCFLVNEMICYTVHVPEFRTLCFVFCLLSKLLDLAMIFLFYLYVRETLGFEGKLASIAEKLIPALMIAQTLVMLSNIITPVTFTVAPDGMYQDTSIFLIEEIFLGVTAILTTVLMFLSHNPFSQKVAALTFVILPLIEYVMLGGTFGEASQYGIVLMSLIIMYCIIFNAKSRKLAATETELNMAIDIQTSMLPSIFPAFPERSEFDIHASMDPAKEVGGDFYDFFMIDDDHLAIVIADVSGKGIPAALFMMSSKILINDHALMGGAPAEVLERVNKRICANNDAHMFVTVWLGILEISTGKLTSASAGHEYPMINMNGKYELLKDKHGLAVGAFETSKYKNTELQLKKGDSIFVYTDGVAEATDANNALFGTERTLEALNSISQSASQKEVLAGVRTAVDAFVNEAPQFDDLTMVGLKYYGPQANTETEDEL
ncbi:PP2C family protein-serine/threonine phosphatase [Ruminococcus sp.]|uniref:PP2C family protein-serine/threonine phosphatase n=1 Tax=Ruminococcus sp. TaxID=41978 RepID=UPI00388EF702